MYEIKENELYSINGGSSKGVAAVLAGIALTAGSVALVCSPAGLALGASTLFGCCCAGAFTMGQVVSLCGIAEIGGAKF